MLGEIIDLTPWVSIWQFTFAVSGRMSYGQPPWSLFTPLAFTDCRTESSSQLRAAHIFIAKMLLSRNYQNMNDRS